MNAPGAALGVIVLVAALIYAASPRTTWLVLRYRFSRAVTTAVVALILLGAVSDLAGTPE
ncbi:hypothetical protein O7627_33070 [Solwaraspora sp. WMMD1047]|uniref:hypothetical protein n=1 Tax=Solwaraspora sp. WMMD1047 TaxID=3016102 RepID=UPI002415C538|nr:hypothetical protein [Solwaraspora sp. WMMD1047]MDG4834097.1 hypothetical protein [Solwaraspora sp. WMMD1047]